MEKTDAPKREDAREGEARVLNEYEMKKIDPPNGECT